MEAEASPIWTRPDDMVDSSPLIGMEEHSREYWEDQCYNSDMAFVTFQERAFALLCSAQGCREKWNNKQIT